MKVKTSELTGPALDWAVAKCEGETESVQFSAQPSSRHYYAPSRKWAQGGPIIEREKLTVGPCYSNLWWAGRCDVMDDDHTTGQDGPTPLIVAMRCYVASKLGDEIEVPDELLK